MNIMNIGLQGQLIGVNGPVQANHNMLNVNNVNQAKLNHKRSQSQASNPQPNVGQAYAPRNPQANKNNFFTENSDKLQDHLSPK